MVPRRWSTLSLFAASGVGIVGGVVIATVEQAAIFGTAPLVAVVSAMCGSAITVPIVLLRTWRERQKRSERALDLAHAINAVSVDQDCSIRALRRSDDDDVGLLVDTFNNMISRNEIKENRLINAVERAEAAKTAKADLLAMMSHEIRTPLNGIIGMAQLLLEAKAPAEQEEFARTIHQSAQSLLEIINDVLDFSKGEAGRHEIEKVPFSVSEVVDACMATMSPIACRKDIELNARIDEHVPERLVGDPNRIRQVILNLVGNAVKFTPEGEVAVNVVLESKSAKTASIRFDVRDTGIGIAEDRIPRLFQRYVQADASDTRVFGGTGLGLMISKQLADAMGGRISVKSKKDEGSTFSFSLRLPTESVPAPEAEERGLSGLRILVVEQNAATRQGLASMLTGNELELCASGIAGRQTLLESDGRFDLVVLDVRLLEDFGAANRELELPFPSIPLILLVPIDQLLVTPSLHWPGPTAHAGKPVNRKDLRWCLSELLQEATPAIEPASKPPADAPEHDLTGARVLIAEDHPVNQRVAAGFLEKLRVDWTLVESGEEAVDTFRRETFDLVLMDMQMPGMGGAAAIAAIRELEAVSGSRTPVLTMTASVSPADLRECEAAGCDGHVSKPILLEELAGAMRRWLARARAA